MSNLTFKVSKALQSSPYVINTGSFSNEELDLIAKYCEENKQLEEGQVGSGNINKEIRNSKIKLFAFNPNTRWIFNRFKTIIEQANNDFFRYDLIGFEFFQYSEYDGPGTKYIMHTDMDIGKSGKWRTNIIRKLSLTMLLSQPGVDFDGGEFQIYNGERLPTTIPLQRGQVVLFPSWTFHKVNDVKSGNRKSIVIWVVGPKFK